MTYDAKDAWEDLAKNTQASAADVAAGRVPNAEHRAFYHLSDTCSIQLGSSDIKRVGSAVDVQVRIERGGGGASCLDYTHILHADTAGLTKMLEKAVRVGRASFKETLASVARDVSRVLIGLYGVEVAKSAFEKALVEDVMES